MAKSLAVLIVIGGLTLLSIVTEVGAAEPEARVALAPAHTDLIVGSGNRSTQQKIGEVFLSDDGHNLSVRYLIENAVPTDPAHSWCLTATRLQVSPSLAGIPQARGAANPASFSYHQQHDCVTDYTYTIPMSWASGASVFVAANADVMLIGGLEALPHILPDHATVTVQRPSPNPKSYFEAKVTDGGFLDGTYTGWCIDTRHRAVEKQAYTAKVYSSYAPLPAGVVDHPENLDRVNWLVNQGLVGKPSPAGLGEYTYGDMQRAIWTILENGTLDLGLGQWNLHRVNELVTLAMANGAGFRPACDQSTAVVLVPVNANGKVHRQVTIGQTSIVNLGIPCTPASSSAWGNGNNFPCGKGKSCSEEGSMYFVYNGQY